MRFAVALLAAAIPSTAAPSEVRVGGLFQRSSIKWARYAAAVMAVDEINSRSDLLAETTLRYAVKDSACSAGYALVGAHELIQTSFSGTGVAALIGATCSGGSAAAAGYAALYEVPQLSPSSTSAALSDSSAYPYFARTAPSDAWQSFALADLVQNVVASAFVATVSSEDTYGSTGMQEFLNEAQRRKLVVLGSTSFANGQTEFAEQIDVLRRSGARVFVIFCQGADAKAFIKAAQAEGVGGQNFTWVGSEAATQAVSEDSELEAALLGYAGLGPSAGTSNEFEQVRCSSSLCSLCSLCCPPQRQFQAL